MSDPTQRPTAAGMYDYYLGGTANTPADREAGEDIRAAYPEISEAAWANRGFLQRAVKQMAAEWKLRQFIDVGAGLPTQRNTHEVVGEVINDGRVVYVDSDPQVIARGQVILAGQSNTALIQADIRQPDDVLNHPETRRLIDFSEPVGLLMASVTQFIQDEQDPVGVVRRYLDAVPSGSYLALSAPTLDHQPEWMIERVQQIYKNTPTPARARTRAQIEQYFAGLEIMPPYPGAPGAVTFIGLWGAEDPEAADDDANRSMYAALGRKP